MADQYDFNTQEELIKSITVKSGKIFINKERIEVAKKGDPGLMGPSGLQGNAPRHEWRGTEIRFQNPDNTWGPWVDLKGPPGNNGKDGEKGPQGDSVKGERGDSGDKGVQGNRGDHGEKGDRGLPGKNGENGKDGKPGTPGIEPVEMSEIRNLIIGMKKALDLMAVRVCNVQDGTNGIDGKDGKNGKDGVTLQGPAGPQGDKGNPGIPPHDWNETLNKVGRIVVALEKKGIEI